MCKVTQTPRPLPQPQMGIDNLAILSFNVEGLSAQLNDSSFHDLLNLHDINILTETWRSSDSKIELTGFWDYSQVRPKHKNAIRHSGGISILIRKELRKGIKIAQDIEGFVWLKFDKTFFD